MRIIFHATVRYHNTALLSKYASTKCLIADRIDTSNDNAIVIVRNNQKININHFLNKFIFNEKIIYALLICRVSVQ